MPCMLPLQELNKTRAELDAARQSASNLEQLVVYFGCIDSVDWNGGMDWTGTVEWTGMERWNELEWNGGLDWN